MTSKQKMISKFYLTEYRFSLKNGLNNFEWNQQQTQN